MRRVDSVDVDLPSRVESQRSGSGRLGRERRTHDEAGRLLVDDAWQDRVDIVYERLAAL